MFQLDGRISEGSHFLADLRLCHVRLQGDARFPWTVLVPRVAQAVELTDLSAADGRCLLQETLAAGEAVRAVGRALGKPVHKLNHGQLGNLVAQLHVHVVGRRPEDAAWPEPVWGAGAAEPYAAEALSQALDAARRALG